MYQWLTTAPNPRVSQFRNEDAGQRGWCLHAIKAVDSATFNQVRFEYAACGLRAKHGWGLDMFIKRKCKKCLKALDLS
jgi:hypothetical protein